MLIDIHVHSRHTEGSPLTIPELVEQVGRKGLDGFCLTDVHTVAGGPEAKRLAAEAGLVALVGFEAITDRGHFLVFVPAPDQLPAISKWLRFDDQGRIPFSSLVKAVEDLDGVLIAAHPYDRSVEPSPGDGVIQLEGVSALEVLNARRSELVNALAEEVAAGLGLPGVAGSDARAEAQDIGRMASLVPGPLDSEADLIDHIRGFHVWPVRIGAVPKPPRRQRPPRGEGGRRRGERKSSAPGRKAGPRPRPGGDKPTARKPRRRHRQRRSGGAPKPDDHSES